MVGLNLVGIVLQIQLFIVVVWVVSGVVDLLLVLLCLVDVVFYVESMVGNFECGECCIIWLILVEFGQEVDVFVVYQLVEVCIVVIEEVKVGLVLVKCVIIVYLEFNGDKFNLVNVLVSLQVVWGGFWFFGQECVVLLVGGCVDYIQQCMIEIVQMFLEQMLEIFVDVLISFEYYFEGGVVLCLQGQLDVFDLVSVSVKVFGLLVVV